MQNARHLPGFSNSRQADHPNTTDTGAPICRPETIDLLGLPLLSFSIQGGDLTANYPTRKLRLSRCERFTSKRHRSLSGPRPSRTSR